MPSGNKKSKQRQTKRGASLTGSVQVHFRVGSEPQPSTPWPRRMVKRSTPNMAMDSARTQELKNAVLGIPEPERSPTAKRFAKAYRLVEEVDKSVEASPHAGSRDIPIGVLVEDGATVRDCAKLIEAMILTDFRVGFNTSILKNLPMPDCWANVTSLTPLGQTTVQLIRMGSREFVILLASAICLNMLSQPKSLAASKRIIHELHAHVEGGYDWLDWSELEDVDLTETTCRFALASVGVKVSRRLFRMNADQRQASVFPAQDRMSTRKLLTDVETFAQEQCQLRPDCAVGYWNLGWVVEQSPSRRNADGLAAAAECLRIYTQTYEIADAEGDDFFSAAARIEAAGMICLGGGGLVGVTVPDGTGQVRRDFRAAFALSSKDKDSSKNTEMLKIACHADTEIGTQAILVVEKRRAEEGVPMTTLGPDEKLLIEWWQVLKLWNDAMEPYDALSSWEHGFFVYGECSHWDNCVQCLKVWMEEQRLDLGRLQYALCPFEHGIPNRMRDHGQGYQECEVCKKPNSYNTCSRCKRVQYCSTECQRKDWRAGHKQECRAPL